MRLPGVEATFGAPVPDIRRANVGPEVYEARNQAIQGILDLGIKVAKDVNDRDQESKYTASLSGAAVELEELRAKLTTSNVLDVDDIPAEIEIDEADIEETPEGRKIPTFKVGKQVWDHEVSRVREAYGSRVKNRAFRQRFDNDVASIQIKGSVELITSSIKQQQEFGKVTLVNSLEGMVSLAAADPSKESTVFGSIARQAAMGNITPVDAINMTNEYGEKIDRLRYTTKMLAARTPEQRSQLREELWNDKGTRLTVETKLAIDKEMDRIKREYERDRTRIHNEGFNELTSGFLNGSLTLGDLTRMKNSDRISEQHYNTFRVALQTRENRENAGQSTDTVSDGIRTMIAQAGWATNQKSVSLNFKQVRNVIRQRSMGVDASGEPLPEDQIISGEDAINLLRDVELAEKRAIRGPSYDDAHRLIQTYTGVKPGVDGTVTGSQGQRDAYASFLNALNAHVDRYGVEADPTKFVKDNVRMFDPQVASENASKKFLQKYPELQQFSLSRGSTKVTGSTFDERRGQIDKGKALYHIQTKMLKSNDPATRARGLQALREYLAVYEDRGLLNGSPEQLFNQIDETFEILYGLNNTVGVE